MPTGYTADIGKGLSFQQFAANCSEAFGESRLLDISAKDILDVNGEVCFDATKFLGKNNTSYYIGRIAELKKELEQISSLSIEEYTNFVSSKLKEDKKEAKAQMKKEMALEKKYKEMLKKVKEWTPPTNDHIGFKKFMIEQIESSIKFDCGHEFYKDKLNANMPTDLEEHKKNAVDRIKEWIVYMEDSIEKENKIFNGAVEWVDALVKSLKGKE